MLGRSILAHMNAYFEGLLRVDYGHDQLLELTKACMASVFEVLAAEIAVIRMNQPALTAEAFAKLLLANANYIEDQQCDESIEEEPESAHRCEWLNHPSLTPEQRNQ